MKTGTIYLIATPISKDQTMSDITLKMYLDEICKLKHFITETPKIARSYLKDLPLNNKIQDLNIVELSEHTQEEELVELLEPLLEGDDIGLISDAGIPTVADPGYRIVSLAQEKCIDIVPFVGPSSIILSLMASGLNGQNFSFNGYLPKDKGLKRKRIKTLERIALNTNQTQIFMEVPYKNQHMLEDILEICEDQTRLCIAKDIMSEKEYIKTKKISQWRKEDIFLEKAPCLFLLNK
jgi:16S rRNA (cytidine1402-2'-O)-methyltransferase